jgi:hypothetical protein
VAVSRQGVRFLFEVGPEFAAKPAYAKAWKRAAPRLRRSLGQTRGLGWFKNEHDQEPAAALATLDSAGWKALGDELTRTRDGQLVLGRHVEAREAATWRGADYEQAALDTFAGLAVCFRLG